MITTFRIDIASVPDRDEPVAELWYGDEQVAELRRESGEHRLQVFAPRSVTVWDFSFDDFLTALDTARRRL